MKKARFYWKSTCSTCRNARAFLRDDLAIDLDERDYAKQPFTLDELKSLFANADPRDYLNPKSPTFKAMGLSGKRPLLISGRTIIAGFDRDRYRELLK
jgi:arsenate reductase-like glutaredoxin family protein